MSEETRKSDRDLLVELIASEAHLQQKLSASEKEIAELKKEREDWRHAHAHICDKLEKADQRVWKEQKLSEERRKMLAEFEWIEIDDCDPNMYVLVCKMCRRQKHQGHADGCEMGKLIL